MLKWIFKLFSVLPLWLLHALGALLGVLVYVLASGYRRKMLEHSLQVFGNNHAERKRAVLRSIIHAGMGIMELPYLWGRPTAKGAGRSMELEGWQWVEAAKQQGKGLVFLTPHSGSFEAAAQIFSLRAPITVLYRPNRNAQVQSIIEESRSRNNIDIAPTNVGGVKKLLKALKRGEAVGMLPDQVPAAGEGEWARYFGKPAYTMTLPGRLVQATGAKVILALGVRKPFRGFRLELYPGPEQLSADPIEAANQINQAMETLILRRPDQYYWGYERFKLPKGYTPQDIQHAERN